MVAVLARSSTLLIIVLACLAGLMVMACFEIKVMAAAAPLLRSDLKPRKSKAEMETKEEKEISRFVRKKSDNFCIFYKKSRIDVEHIFLI